ncbi:MULTISPECIES: TlpA family protein disulfide reductase [unclassified Nocardioides]|uniref:TlpA family protein disulfide reductase n=1 Tax=unclassified Nocardioides TaxID=2615069 RepID=UPI0009F0DC14|nr:MULTISPECIES: TlpA disulfide reductase family protein [unclassified Nocardioides]GAW49773.1 Redoxin domain protein [Nocardioides sp. PD653-B2]GAW56487.1 Redoxin domain protein [Nocardioides sp. PD653]
MSQQDPQPEASPTRSRWLIVAMVALPVLLAAGLFGVAHSWTPTAGRSDGPSTPAGLTLFEPSERQPIPPIGGADLEGKPLNTDKYAGKILVFNLWGSWCAPCRAEAPALAEVATATRRQGVQFIGINTRDNESGAQAFVSDYAIPYPSFFDRDGRVILHFQGIAPLRAVPSTIFVDANGSVAAVAIGEIGKSTLQGVIDDLIAERNGESRP